MNFTRLVVGPLETNCYILWDAGTGHSAIIDPGGDAKTILSALESHKLTAESIILTHGHPDHTFAAGELSNSFSIPIRMHESDSFLLTGALSAVEHCYDMAQYLPFECDEYLRDGQHVSVGGSEFEVVHTPGHSPGGLCIKTDIGVFCGDTLFAGSVGRTDFLGGSFQLLLDSIKNRILVLDDSVVLHPGHGPETTVGRERRTNPFIQT